GLGIAPGLLLGIGDIHDAAIHDAVASWILAARLQRLDIDANLLAAADACERHIELGAAPNRLGSARTPEQLGMRLAHRPRKNSRVAELEILSVEAEALAGPRAFQDLHRLERPAEPLFARHPEALELLGAVAKPDSEPQPAMRKHIDEGGIFGELQRMVKRREQNVGADSDARRARRYRCRRRHHRGQVAIVGEMMLSQPDRIEAERLRRGHLCKRRIVEIAKRQLRSRRISKIELVANFYFAHDSH